MDDESPARQIVADSSPPGVVGNLRPHALALMFVAGACLALTVLLFPGTDDVDRVPWIINALLGLPVAAVLWRWGHRFSEPMLHAALVGGAVIVALGMTFGNGGSLTVAASVLFVTCVGLGGQGLSAAWRRPAGRVKVERPQRSEDVRP